MRTPIRVYAYLLLTLWSPFRSQGASVKDLVLANEGKFSVLQIERKCEEASRLLADDFQSSTGQRESKSNFLSACKSGGIIVTADKMSNVEFRLHTPNMAVVSFQDDLDFILDGKPAKAQLYVNSVWVKHGSKWLMHLHTSTPMPFVVTQEGKLRLLYYGDEEKHDESSGQKEIESQIIALEKQAFEAKGNDLLKFEAEDYESIKHAHRYAREDDLAADKDMKMSSFSMNDIRVRMLRPDVALITYHGTQKGSFRGTKLPTSLYFGSLWINRGEWKNAFFAESAPDVFTDTYMPGSLPKNEATK